MICLKPFHNFLLCWTDRHSHATVEVQKEEEKKFKELGEAYSVLSDDKKRARYDNGQDLDDSCGGFSGNTFLFLFFLPLFTIFLSSLSFKAGVEFHNSILTLLQHVQSQPARNWLHCESPQTANENYILPSCTCMHPLCPVMNIPCLSLQISIIIMIYLI